MNPNDTFLPVPNWLASRRDVSATAKLLYGRIRQYQGENGTAWPGIATLAEEIGAHRTRIIANLRELERLELLQIEHRAGYRASNRYRVLVPTGSEKRLVAKSDQLQIATSLVAKRDFTSSEKRPQEIKEKNREEIQPPVEIPAALDTEPFKAAWTEFQEHRRQLRKPLTPLAATKQLLKLAGMGPARAVAAIQHSIASGWQGIFEPSANGGNKNGTTDRNRGTYNEGKAAQYANLGKVARV